ncbi:hypothetical protein RQP46_009435 [Phenoliferia psychrophenolica]
MSTPTSLPNPIQTPVAEELLAGAPITSTHSMEAGAHHYLLCLDPEDSDASTRALQYTKSRLAHKGDLVVLFSVLQHPLSFPLDDWAAPGFTSIYSSAVDKVAMKELEKQLQDVEVERLAQAAKGFQDGVRVLTRVEFVAAAPKIEKICEAAQIYVSRLLLSYQIDH